MLEVSTLTTKSEIGAFFDSMSSGRICFLVGAGVSIASGIPGAMAILGEIIERLPIPDNYKKELISAQSEDWERAVGPYDYLRFEQVMSALEQSLDPQLSILSGLSVAAKPNGTHYRLAYLIALGHYVVTTNFDDLIEQACRELGIDVLIVVTDDDFAAFEAAPRLVSVLFKIHGSVERGGIRHRVVATFEDVIGEPVVSVDKWKTVSRILATSDLVVLGYSGSDDFDVLPALFCERSNFRVYWIQHDDGSHSFPYRLKWTFGRQFLSSALGQYTERAAERFHMATAPTDMVMDFLVRGWVSTRANKSAAAPHMNTRDLRHSIAILFNSCAPSRKYFLAGLLFFNCGDMPMANACFEKARIATESSKNLFLALVSAYDAIAWSERWEMERARAAAGACLQHVNSTKAVPHRLASIVFLALCCGEQYGQAKRLGKRTRFPAKIMRQKFNRWAILTLMSQELLNFIASTFEAGIGSDASEAKDKAARETYAAFRRELSVSEIASSRHPLAAVQRQLHGDADLLEVFFQSGERQLKAADGQEEDLPLMSCREIYERLGTRSRLGLSCLLHGYSYRRGGWINWAFESGAFARMVFAKLGNRSGVQMVDRLMYACQVPALDLGGKECAQAEEFLECSFRLLLRPPEDSAW